MGWFHSAPSAQPAGPSQEQVDALRREVEDLAKDDYLLATFLTDRTLRRFLVGRGLSVDKAAKALRKTLAWRKEFRPDTTTWGDLEPGRTRGGRLEVIPERDAEGRPVLFYRVRAPTLPASGPQYLRFWFYILESLSQLGDEVDSKALLVFDMDGYSDPKAELPPFWTRLEAIQLAQAHYPEQLARAVVGNPPLLFWALWKALQPLLDPVTKAKVVFASHAADVKATLDPLLPPGARYPSLGGTKPEPPDYEAMSALMRGLDERRLACQEKTRRLMGAAPLGGPPGAKAAPGPSQQGEAGAPGGKHQGLAAGTINVSSVA